MPTRYVWLPAAAFTAVSGATGPSPVGSDTSAARKIGAYVFPNSDSVITTEVVIPRDWTGGAITVTYHWTKGDSPITGAVAWDWIWAQVDPGSEIDQNYDGVLSASVPGAGTLEALARSAIGAGFTPALYRTIRGSVRRNAGPYTGNAWLIGVELAYPAS